MSKSNQTTMQSEIFIVLMIFAILLFIVVFQTLEEITVEKTSLENKIEEYSVIKDDYERIKEALTKLKENQQPPLIVLKEAEGYAFNTNSATLSYNFRNKLNGKIVKKIKTFAQEYNCDIVEVYGYTDGEPFGKSNGTADFDKKLHNCLVDGCDIDSIKSSSNLELGMQRAISVVKSLNKLLKHNAHIKIIRPYSGGQFIDSHGKISNINNNLKNSSRRRIEIRLSRSSNLLKSISKNINNNLQEKKLQNINTTHSQNNPFNKMKILTPFQKNISINNTYNKYLITIALKNYNSNLKNSLEKYKELGYRGGIYLKSNNVYILAIGPYSIDKLNNIKNNLLNKKIINSDSYITTDKIFLEKIE